ncbi:MAG: hypothetical protein HY342_01710 [Candidatus Lambdaproteobacteria bacterium]|nr:hypothetical protein [Candidatus Lambdaproteobacteria bacterium]
MGIFRFLIYALVGYLAYLFYKRVMAAPSKRPVDFGEDSRIGRLVQDPQCELYVDRNEAVRRKVGGQDVYFCSKECADAYVQAQREAQ